MEAVLIDLENAHGAATPARSSRWAKLALAAGAGVVIALVASLLFLGENDPGQQADGPAGVPAPTPVPPEPTPDPTAADPVATGDTADPPPLARRLEPLTFTYRQDLGTGWPMAIETVGDTTFIATTRGPPSFKGARGLVLWRRVADGPFENLGAALTEATVLSATASTDDELLVVGNAADGALTVWRTADGTAWTDDRIADSGSATAITMHDGAIHIAAGDPGFGLPPLPTVPLGDPRLGWSFSGGRDGLAVIVTAPLGLSLLELTAAEAGLTEDDLAALVDRPSSDEVEVWSDAGGSWRASLPPAFSVESLVVVPDGRLLATGNGSNGEAAWIRDETDSWTAVDIGLADRVFRSEPDGVHGVRVGAVGASPDGVSDWTWIDIDRVIPGTAEVFFSETASDGSTLTALVDALEDGRDREPTPVLLIKDGYELRLDLARGRLLLRADATDLADIAIWNMEVNPAQFTGDIEQGTVTFIDPRTGRPGPTVGFDELIAMEDAALDGLRQPLYALATTDGRGFHVTATTEFLPLDHELDLLAPDGDTIIGVVIDNAGLAAAEPPRLEVWTAPLPRSGRVTGALPDGTRFELRGDAAWARGPVEDISAAIRVDLPDGTSPVAGIASFARRQSGDGITHDRYVAAAGDWRFELALYPEVVEALGPDTARQLHASISTSLDSGVPVIELAPPFRWADDDDTPLRMEVNAGWIAIRRGCGDEALACSPDGEIQAVFGRPVPRLIGPDLELAVIPGPPGN